MKILKTQNPVNYFVGLAAIATMAKTKAKKSLLVSTLVLVCFLGNGAAAHASSYSAWVEMTGSNTFAINPFAGGTLSPFSLWLDPALAYGVNDDIDVFFSAATMTLVDEFSYDGYWIMPRYQIVENKIVALYAGKDSFAPQFHWIINSGSFRLEFNAYASFPYETMEPAIGAIIAPVVTITGGFKGYLEIDPVYDVGSSTFDMTFVPGVAYAADSFGEISVGFPISDAGDVSFAMWYWKGFSI